MNRNIAEGAAEKHLTREGWNRIAQLVNDRYMEEMDEKQWAELCSELCSEGGAEERDSAHHSAHHSSSERSVMRRTMDCENNESLLTGPRVHTSNMSDRKCFAARCCATSFVIIAYTGILFAAGYYSGYYNDHDMGSSVM
jgi:hypothetical protein